MTIPAYKTAVRGSCPQCSTADQLLYLYEPTDESLGRACPECVRKRAKTVERTTPCDKCGKPAAWRNPFTRRNEYLCGTHHAESGEGVVLNKWFARFSSPHPQGRKVKCEVADNHCRGEVKPRTLTLESGKKTMTLLCTKHAGKTSAAWAVEDGEV